MATRKELIEAIEKASVDSIGTRYKFNPLAGIRKRWKNRNKAGLLTIYRLIAGKPFEEE